MATSWGSVVLLATASIVTFIQGQVTYRTCPDSWSRYGDSCYHFVDQDLYHWVEAAHYCQTQQAHLVSIETAAEDNYVKNQATRLHRNSHDRSHVKFWAGGTDEVIEGEWIWYNSNAKMNFTRWLQGQPDSAHHHNEDCLLLDGSHMFAWTDTPCMSKALPICEIEAPRPAAVPTNGIIG